MPTQHMARPHAIIRPRMHPTFPFALATALAVVATPAMAQLVPGTKAPAIQFGQQFNFPAPVAALADLQGGAVLLEFWATW